MLKYFVPISDSKDAVILDDATQNDLVAMARQEFLDWVNETQEFRDMALESRQLYIENMPDNLKYDTLDAAKESLSRIRRPVLSQAVDSVVSQQHLSSFPMDERFFKGRPKNDVASKKCLQYEKYIERRLSKIDFMINTLKDRKNLILDGVSCVWHPYIVETKQKVTYEFPTLFGIPVPIPPKKSKQEANTFEGTGFIPLSLFDWAVNPKVDNIYEADFQWRRWVSVDYVKSIPQFENTDDLTNYHDTVYTDTSGSSKDTYYSYLVIRCSYQNINSQIAKTMVLLYERWGDFYINDKYYNNHVLMYSNDGTFHYFGPNPYDHGCKPFSIVSYIPMQGTLYGKSMAQDIIPLHHASDTLVNQGIDILSRTANPTFLYDSKDDVLMQFFKNKPSLMPGEGIPCRDIERSVKALVWDFSALTFIENMLQLIKEEIRESTGGVPYTTGGASQEDQQRTLGEVEILAQGTNTRFQLFIQMYEEGRLKPYLHFVFENDRQFMTEDAFIEDDGDVLTPKIIKMMDIEFDVTGSKTVMSKSSEINETDKIIAAIPVLEQSGLIERNGDRVIMNIPELMKRSLTLKGIRDIDNFMEIVTVEEQQQQQSEMPTLGRGLNGSPSLPSVIPIGAVPNMGQPQANPGMVSNTGKAS